MITLKPEEVEPVLDALENAALTASFPVMTQHYRDLAAKIAGMLVPSLSAYESVTVISAMMKVRNYDLAGSLSDRSPDVE